MSIRALSLDKTWEFQSKHDLDKGKENATIFVLRTLDSRVYGHLRDKATKMLVDPKAPDDQLLETTVAQNEVFFDMCQFGIESWRNFTGESAGDLACDMGKRTLGSKSYAVVKTDVLVRVPGAVIADVAHAIMKGNELSEEEGKGSGSP